MQNLILRPWLLTYYLQMLAARLTSASSFLVAKDSPVSPTDKISYIILVGLFLCLLLWFNKWVALSSNHCTGVILEIWIFCWHKHIYLVLVLHHWYIWKLCIYSICICIYIYIYIWKLCELGMTSFFYFFFFFPYVCPFKEWNRFLCCFSFLLVYGLFMPETKLHEYFVVCIMVIWVE